MEVAGSTDTEATSMFSFMQQPTTVPSTLPVEEPAATSSFSFLTDADVQNNDSQTGFSFLNATDNHNSDVTGFQFMSTTSTHLPDNDEGNAAGASIQESYDNLSSFSFLQQTSPTVRTSLEHFVLIIDVHLSMSCILPKQSTNVHRNSLGSSASSDLANMLGGEISGPQEVKLAKVASAKVVRCRAC